MPRIGRSGTAGPGFPAQHGVNGRLARVRRARTAGTGAVVAIRWSPAGRLRASQAQDRPTRRGRPDPPRAHRRNHWPPARNTEGAAGRRMRETIRASALLRQALRRTLGLGGQNGEMVMRGRLCVVILAAVAVLAAGCGTRQASADALSAAVANTAATT